jgi:hypothetical protein
LIALNVIFINHALPKQIYLIFFRSPFDRWKTPLLSNGLRPSLRRCNVSIMFIGCELMLGEILHPKLE